MSRSDEPRVQRAPLHEPVDTAERADAAARPSRGLLLGLLVFVLLFGAAGYGWLGNPAGLAVAPGRAVPAQAETAAALPSQADFSTMAERLA